MGDSQACHSSTLAYHLTVLVAFGATTGHWDDHRGDGPGELIANLNVNSKALYAFEHDVEKQHKKFNYSTVANPGDVVSFFGPMRHFYTHSVYRLDADGLGPGDSSVPDDIWADLGNAAMNHPELSMRIVVTARWGKPSREWYALCGEKGVGFGADAKHLDAWEPPFTPPTVKPTKAKTPPKQRNRRRLPRVPSARRVWRRLRRSPNKPPAAVAASSTTLTAATGREHLPSAASRRTYWKM